MFNIAQRLLLLWFWDTGCEASTKAEAGCPTELPGVGVHKSRGRMPYRASRSRGAQRQLCHLQSNCQGPRSQDAPSSPGDKDVRGPPRRYIKSLSFLSLSTVIPTAFQVVGCLGNFGKLAENASWRTPFEHLILWGAFETIAETRAHTVRSKDDGQACDLQSKSPHSYCFKTPRTDRIQASKLWHQKTSFRAHLHLAHLQSGPDSSPTL